MTLIYKHKRGAEIHQMEEYRGQPYTVWKPTADGMGVVGFEATYIGALTRLAKSVQDRVLQARLKDTAIFERVPKERRHRAVAR